MGSMDSLPVVHSQRSSTRDQVTTREWNDLPSELLPSIADRLGIIELLRFRGVCKDWNFASSTASAEIEALPNRDPWFLLYGENNNSQCTLVTESGKQYIITIPEMDGATCLASSLGWLLLYREGLIFFFCPFSRARIDLPVPTKFPPMGISDHVAVFSTPPTSQDCVVCIICRTNKTDDLELYVIHRGATSWTKHKLSSFPNKIECAAYHNGVFYYFDNTDLMVCFSIKDRSISLGKVRYVKSPNERCIPLKFISNVEKEDMKKRLDLELGDVSTCGTTVSCLKADKMVPYENRANAKGAGTRRPKGVWFQPRFHQIDKMLSW
ncbi:hypothetical protein V6Z11_A12G009500 [Gossypium hirsutum]|nr:hypothetical protein ES288_A12G008400v1 [Gossypium darwinii]TYH93949.1 hypothetical protein ES332_A12G008600v1 [Gossypium tomentosum]